MSSVPICTLVCWIVVLLIACSPGSRWCPIHTSMQVRRPQILSYEWYLRSSSLFVYRILLYFFGVFSLDEFACWVFRLTVGRFPQFSSCRSILAAVSAARLAASPAAWVGSFAALKKLNGLKSEVETILNYRNRYKIKIFKADWWIYKKVMIGFSKLKDVLLRNINKIVQSTG